MTRREHFAKGLRLALETYALSERDECQVEDEHSQQVRGFLDMLPSVVFRSERISALAPVVECQPYTPCYGEDKNVIQSLSGEILLMRPEAVMADVNWG